MFPSTEKHTHSCKHDLILLVITKCNIIINVNSSLNKQADGLICTYQAVQLIYTVVALGSPRLTDEKLSLLQIFAKR